MENRNPSSQKQKIIKWGVLTLIDIILNRC
nr:MAG TPA: hypothetical protein [Caudoviricetes sp.]